MKVLGIDTSTKQGSMALIDEEEILFESKFFGSLTNTEILLPHLEKFLKSLSLELSEIDGFSVGLGPGSFTGLRIGLSTMKAFAQALQKPLVGISSLFALAHNGILSNKPVAALMDAKRGELYGSIYQFKEGIFEKVLLPEQVLSPQNFASVLKSIGSSLLMGDGALAYENFFKEELKEKISFAPKPLMSLQARWVGLLGIVSLKKGEGKNWEVLTPNYVRLSDAEKSQAGKQRPVDVGKRRDS